jgi:hypothetical protein
MPSPVGPRMNPFPSTKPPADDRPSAKGSTPGVGGSAPSIKPPASKPIGIDRDGDGKIDIFVTPKPGIGIDTDGDGIIDISFPKEPPTSQPPSPKSPAFPPLGRVQQQNIFGNNYVPYKFDPDKDFPK